VRKKKTLWEVIRIRAKGQYLGRVKGSDKESARKAAAKEFELRDGEERWLIIRPAYGSDLGHRDRTLMAGYSPLAYWTIFLGTAFCTALLAFEALKSWGFAWRNARAVNGAGVLARPIVF
jgi:hypothetical protein